MPFLEVCNRGNDICANDRSNENIFPDEIQTDNVTSIVDVSTGREDFDITVADISPAKF